MWSELLRFDEPASKGARRPLHHPASLPHPLFCQLFLRLELTGLSCTPGCHPTICVESLFLLSLHEQNATRPLCVFSKRKDHWCLLLRQISAACGCFGAHFFSKVLDHTCAQCRGAATSFHLIENKKNVQMCKCSAELVCFSEKRSCRNEAPPLWFFWYQTLMFLPKSAHANEHLQTKKSHLSCFLALLQELPASLWLQTLRLCRHSGVKDFQKVPKTEPQLFLLSCRTSVCEASQPWLPLDTWWQWREAPACTVSQTSFACCIPATCKLDVFLSGEGVIADVTKKSSERQKRTADFNVISPLKIIYLRLRLTWFIFLNKTIFRFSSENGKVFLRWNYPQTKTVFWQIRHIFFHVCQILSFGGEMN